MEIKSYDNYEDAVSFLRKKGGNMTFFGYQALDEETTLAVTEVVLFAAMVDALGLDDDQRKLLQARAALLFNRAYYAGYYAGENHTYETQMVVNERQNAVDLMEKKLKGEEITETDYYIAPL